MRQLCKGLLHKFHGIIKHARFRSHRDPVIVAVGFNPRIPSIHSAAVASRRVIPKPRKFGFAMANTFTSLYYHLVFSTKNRERWITTDSEQRVWAYMAGIAKENQMVPVQIGGVDDHVHLLLGTPATLAPSKIAQLIKGGTSAWIHDTFPNMNMFAWQDGYAAFTVSKSNIDSVADYIRNQREHHRTKTFQEEYIAFLKKHGVDYDERYVWG